MPIETRPPDAFTRDNLLLGFPIVEFTPRLTGGGFGTPVPIGILSEASLQKTVETLTLDRGDAGLITVDREIVSRLEVQFEVQTFNFRADLARYIFASSSIAAVTADPAAAVTDEPIALPSASPFDTFINLARGSIAEASVEVECATVSAEAVGTGDGASGGTQGDFSLDYKIKAIGDVTSFLVGGVEQLANLVAGSTPAAGEIAIEVGEEDSPVTGSGAITFGATQIPANGAAIVATYKPSFTTTAGDIVNPTDFVFDPVLGRIRFLHAGADASPFRLTAASAQQPLLIDYTYTRLASNTLKPFTQNQFEGKASIKQLTDIGVNFDWQIPSASIRITDDELSFGAEDFAVAVMLLNVLDAGGTDRFGTLEWSSEVEANA